MNDKQNMFTTPTKFNADSNITSSTHHLGHFPRQVSFTNQHGTSPSSMIDFPVYHSESSLMTYDTQDVSSEIPAKFNGTNFDDDFDPIEYLSDPMKSYLDGILASPSKQNVDLLINDSSQHNEQFENGSPSNSFETPKTEDVIHGNTSSTTPFDDDIDFMDCLSGPLKSYVVGVLSTPRRKAKLNVDSPTKLTSFKSTSFALSSPISTGKRRTNDDVSNDDIVNLTPLKKEKPNSFYQNATVASFPIDVAVNDDDDVQEVRVTNNPPSYTIISDDDSNTDQPKSVPQAPIVTVVTNECYDSVKKECADIEAQLNRTQQILLTFANILPDKGQSMSESVAQLKSELQLKNDNLATIKVEPVSRQLFPIFERCKRFKKELETVVIKQEHNCNYTVVSIENFNDVSLDHTKLFVKLTFLRTLLAKHNGIKTDSSQLEKHIARLFQEYQQKSAILNSIIPKKMEPVKLVWHTMTAVKMERISSFAGACIDLTLESTNSNIQSNLPETNAIVQNCIKTEVKTEVISESYDLTATSSSGNTVFKPETNNFQANYNNLMLIRNQILLQLNNLQRIAQYYGKTLPQQLSTQIAKLNAELQKNTETIRLFKTEKQQQKTKANGAMSTWAEIVIEAENVQFAGKNGWAEFNAKKRLTMDRLHELHISMKSCPSENRLHDTPAGLRVNLLEHQRYSICWMLWRETQKPRGGILADDMGLGKTLTIISLIVAKKHMKSDVNSSMPSTSANCFAAKGRFAKPNGGTLIVCPASIINQWEQEVKQRTERDLLSVYVYHGSNRENRSDELAEFDMVVTTYALVSREAAFNVCLCIFSLQNIFEICFHFFNVLFRRELYLMLIGNGSFSTKHISSVIIRLVYLLDVHN